MIDNLHRWLIIRLALVWLVLSLIIGGMVQYLGNTRLDNHVVGMAKSETALYSGRFVTYLQSPSDANLAVFNDWIRTQIKQDHLIVIEFYDADSTKVTEVIKPSAEKIEAALPRHDSAFSRKDAISTEKLALGKEIYLRVFIPVFNAAQVKTGYVEGIYHAPPDIVSQIRGQTYWSLIMVVLVILATSLVLYPLIIRLNSRLFEYSRILALTNIGMLKVLGSAVAKRDSDTNIHNYRVTLYSVRIGEKMGLPHSAMQGLIKGAFLHDVGKIAISDTILLKPGKLTAEEFEIMKTHVRHGEEIISSYAWLEDAHDVVAGHHEKFDGSGYPDGAAGSDIPLNARIFAIADVFDALTSRRPYKEPFSLEESLDIISQSCGKHFDPEVTDLFLEHAKTLHHEICHGNETLLHEKLQKCITHYFNEFKR